MGLYLFRPEERMALARSRSPRQQKKSWQWTPFTASLSKALPAAAQSNNLSSFPMAIACVRLVTPSLA